MLFEQVHCIEKPDGAKYWYVFKAKDGPIDHASMYFWSLSPMPKEISITAVVEPAEEPAQEDQEEEETVVTVASES
jgi:hypothetical protein